jgi:hypothetical protein
MDLLTCQMTIKIAGDRRAQSGYVILDLGGTVVPVPIARDHDGRVDHKLSEALHCFFDIDANEIDATVLNTLESRVVTAFSSFARPLPDGCPACGRRVQLHEGRAACSWCPWEHPDPIGGVMS